MARTSQVLAITSNPVSNDHDCGWGFQTLFPLTLHFRYAVSLSLILLMGISSGCTFFSKPAVEEKLDANQAYWFHYESARRGGFLVGADSKIKMCAEPAPDVALART